MSSNDVINKEILNLLHKETRALLEEVNPTKRNYNQLKKKIYTLNNTLIPLLQYTNNQQEDNIIKLFTIIYGLKIALKNFEKYIKPIEEKTKNYTFKILPSFFNTPAKISQTSTESIITHLTSSANLLEQWLKEAEWLEKDEDQLKTRLTRPSHSVQ